MEGGGISARILKMSVVLLEESFKPSTDFQVSIDVLIYIILDVYEFLVLIALILFLPHHLPS